MKNTKECIMKTALGLFLRNSFKGVTMSQIVRKTGLSKGAFYHYFESKERLFSEILNSFFLGSMAPDYSRFSRDSLHQFGRDYLAEVQKRINVSENNRKFSLKNTNYFFLIFEGIKLSPEFRRRFRKQQEAEQKAWESIIRTAREKREIASAMTDEQIAKLFIFVTDGIGMRLVVENKMERMMEEISRIWDGLYNQIKA
jgi:AcrR family transcriptional regulator